jgi:H+/Na+-translocating ferredoxin:NAD+ oxidoreductase subunit D
MEFATAPAPHLKARTSITAMMLEVLAALTPCVLVYLFFFGPGLAVNLLLAAAVAVVAEAAMLKLRQQPVQPALRDASALVTAALLALALPPLTSWWVTAIAALFAIVVAKHFYGGLGYNLFNPAMAGYAVVLISFPVHMDGYLPPRGLEQERPPVGIGATLDYVFTGTLPEDMQMDAVSMASPLDVMQADLGRARMVSEITASPAFGGLGGTGWEWINAAALAGGLWLLFRGIIRWQIPVGVLTGLGGMAFLFNLADADHYASMSFHLFSGATMLGAFFIATDPVSAATTERGRLIYGAGVGVLSYVVRAWGKYPDGVAFAVLIMNMLVPLIDRYTQRRVYGHAQR